MSSDSNARYLRRPFARIAMSGGFRLLFLGLAAVVSLALIACAADDSAQDASTEGPAEAEFGAWGVELEHQSSTVQPGDDFYRYVNEGWLSTAALPPGMPQQNAAVDLGLKTDRQVQAIIADLTSEPQEPGTPEQQIADLYASFIDVDRRNELGFSMLEDELAEVLTAEDRDDLARRMGGVAYEPFIDFGIFPDPGNPRAYIFKVGQSGLGLPNRDYYLTPGEPFDGHRVAYQEYIERGLDRAGVSDAGEKGEAGVAFETAGAGRHWSAAEAADPVKNYKVMTLDELAAWAPGYDWPGFVEETGYGSVDAVHVSTDTAVRDLAALFAETPIEVLRAYTAFHLLHKHSALLSQEWVDGRFAMFNTRLAGIAEQRPVESTGIQVVNEFLGLALGRLYVERHFPAEYKQTLEELVGSLKEALRGRLESLDWMDDATRAEALAKLSNLDVGIGYPDRWPDLSNLVISADDLVGNVHRIKLWIRADGRVKLGEPVRSWEWYNNPHEINAYFAQTRNQIVFPAGILQPPYFDPHADPAVNYGAIGAVIGHEIGHAFDNKGSAYDSTGMLRDWWSAEARSAFEERAMRLVEQYNAYSPVEGVQLDGILTLSENIGDLGGIAMAYTAYQSYAATAYEDGTPPVLDGITGNQRFFLGYGALWRDIATDQAWQVLALTDPHSPGEFRVNGIVRNFDPWYDAFQVPPDDALYMPPDERVTIW